MRTPLVQLLQKLIRPENTPGPDDGRAFRESRRDFIRQLSTAAATTALSGLVPACRTAQKPTIAIVGAGMAGLTAAYYLEKAGLSATLYESADRVGGRVHSTRNLVAEGIVTELGGEFIDTIHTDILHYCREFDLSLLDTHLTSEKGLIGIGYFFNGQHRTERDVIRAFMPFAPRIGRDIGQMGTPLSRVTPHLIGLDQLSIDAYLHQLGMTGWLADLICTSFTSEFGLSAGEQSCLNLLSMLNPDTASKFELYGTSDERYKVIGGNERIITELHKRVKSPVQTGFHLERLATKGIGYALSFANGRQLTADYVVMTLPFSVLRSVTLDVPLSTRKRRCIQELGYGTQSKLFIGVSERIWRQEGYAGVAFSEAIHIGWDSSQMQRANTGPGCYSLLLGGEAGRQLTIDQYDQYLAGCNQVYPGMKQAANGRKNLYNWNRNPRTLGAYSCYRVGQVTALGGAESERAGNIFFAGEHCSQTFQGFMNGAAETGRKAARAISEQLTAKSPERVSVRG